MLLSETYETLCLYADYFQPAIVLPQKERKRSKATKRHDKSKTPYRRVTDSEHTS